MSRYLAASVAILLAFCLASCNTTDSSYGYVAAALDEDSILELIELSDQAINERQFEVFKGLFAPGFYMLDRSEHFNMGEGRLNRFDYLRMSEEIFDSAKEILVYTMVTDIQIEEPGSLALVTVQEDGLLDFRGERKRIVSIAEIEVGFEEGWIYFKSWKTTAKNEIDE